MKKYFFLVMLIAAGVITVLTATTPAKSAIKNSSVHKVKSYATGKLEGRRFAGLYAHYLGVKNKTKLGKYIKIDFQQNFETMWNCKEDRCSSPVVGEASDILTKEYRKQLTPTTYKEYSNHITTVVNKLEVAIDWSAIQKDYEFSETDISLVKSMATSFDGRDMMAYILTELMPSSDGNLNVAFLDFLLRNAGREYVEGIPALYDDKTSFGPYQFTSFAVFQAPGKLEGASVINHAVKKGQKIPGSVIKLRGDDHHRAAFLFATYNLCRLVKGLSVKQKKLLMISWNKNQDDIFLYCATAHHNPAAARRAAHNWIDGKAKHSFEYSCNDKILSYAVKTRNNLKAL